MTPLCPVCHNPLQNTLDNFWSCGPRKITFPRLNTVLTISHATAVWKDGIFTYQHLISGEYAFKIWDEEKNKKTKIMVLKKVDRKYHYSKVKEFTWHDLIEIPAVVSLPWHNPKRVAERVKTYLIFS